MHLNLKILNCKARAHCATCCTDADWRERVVGTRDFECPHGVTADNLPSRGLGDTIAKITTTAKIRPCRGCKKRQAKLNKLIPYKR